MSGADRPGAGGGRPRLHLVRLAEGPRLWVGLHGWSGTHEAYGPLAAHLPPGTGLYAPDLPGCGASPAPHPLTLPAVVGSLAALLDELPGPPPALLGNCTGALLALATALERPARVERLVLIDPFAYVPVYLRLFLRGRLGRLAYLTAFANPLGRWATDRALARHRTGEADLTASFTRADHAVTLAYLHAFAGLGSIRCFSGVAPPVHVVYGERTFGAVRRSVDQWRSLFPGARITELPGVGHLPLAEAPARVARAVFAPA